MHDLSVDVLREVFRRIDYDKRKVQLFLVSRAWCTILFDLSWLEWLDKVVLKKLNSIPGVSCFRSHSAARAISRESLVYVDIDGSVSLAYASDYHSEDSDDDIVTASLRMLETLFDSIREETKKILDDFGIFYDLTEKFTDGKLHLLLTWPDNPCIILR